MNSSNSSSDTAARLLQAATEVFLAQGYTRASVRAITRRAGVNVGAINYHFRDKAELYQAVVREQFQQMVAQVPPVAESNSAAEQLRPLYRQMLAGVVATSVNGFTRLMALEEHSPSGLMAAFWAEVVRPRHEALVRRLALDTGLSETSVEVHRLAKAVIDIGKGYVRDRESMAALSPQLAPSEHWLEETATALVQQAYDLIDGLRRRSAVSLAPQ